MSFPSSTCPNPPNLLPGSIPVEIGIGQTALNIIEAGADISSNRTFIVMNIFGLFYTIRSINTAEMTSSCQWCVKYSPTADESVPSYLLTAAVNDFVIPVSGGVLTLEYTTECNDAQNGLNKGSITESVWLGSRKRHMFLQLKEAGYGFFKSFMIGIVAIGTLASVLAIGARLWTSPNLKKVT